jgi:hypothetical protein
VDKKIVCEGIIIVYFISGIGVNCNMTWYFSGFRVINYFIKIMRKLNKKMRVITFILLLISLRSFEQKTKEKKLIEFGWDYPRSSFIKNHIDQMQETPFDGMIFSFDAGIYNAFDSTQLPDSAFDYNILSKIHWQKLTDNFLFVRGAGHSGPHWLDDRIWDMIVQNLTKVSKALSISKAKGIGFDPEYYYKDPAFDSWVYTPSLYNGLSYEEVGKFVRKRGKQFIRALQTYQPDIKILCFWLLGLVYQQQLHQPISQTGMALYPCFIEGMLEGKNKSSEIIDGNELSYWYQKVENFVTAGQLILQKETVLIDDSLVPEYRNISVAHAVYFDGLFALLPKFNKGFDTLTKERWLRDNLYFAYKTTDKYVWFYSERIDWWNGRGTSDLTKIIKQVQGQIKDQSLSNATNVKRYSFSPDFKKQNIIGNQSFSYRYFRRNNKLQINLLQNDIQTLQIFENAHLIATFENPLQNFGIKLKGKYSGKGNLIVMSKAGNGKTDVAFVN